MITMLHQHQLLKTQIALLTTILIFTLFSGCSSDINYTPTADSNDIAVTHFSYGKIVVDGKTYDHDLIIFPDKTVKYFNAEISHIMQLTDLKPLIDETATTLIIGIGATKMAKVDPDLKEYVESKGIILHTFGTYEAVKLFNSIPKSGVSACFHVGH